MQFSVTNNNYCLQFFPPEGITVFGNMLHTHLAGTILESDCARESTSCMGACKHIILNLIMGMFYSEP